MTTFKMFKSLVFVFVLFCATTTAFSQEDPYIWLEDVESGKSMEWVKEQNKLTAKKMESQPGFAEMKHRFLEVYNDKDKIVYPSTVGKYVYNFWKDDTHVRGIWRRTLRTSFLSGNYTWETVLDIDALSLQEGKMWVFQGANWLEPNYEICLVSLSDGGTDENEMREFNVTTKKFVENGFVLPQSKGGAAWINKDELLVTRVFDDKSATTSGYPRIAKRWKRGTKLELAETVFTQPDTVMGVWAGSEWQKDKMNIFLSKSISFYEHETFMLINNQFVQLNLPTDADAEGSYLGLQILTLNSDWNVDKKAFKAGSLVSVPLADLTSGRGQLDVKLIFEPDAKSSISGVLVTKNGLMLNILRNVQNVLFEMKLENNAWVSKQTEAPEYGRISLVDGSDQETGYFYEYSNYVTPSTLFYVDGVNRSVVQTQKNMFDASNLVVNQYEATSLDGTKIPYFIVHRKDLKMNGSNPTLVYAYGGFNISQKPSYNATNGIGWLEQGGVYVVASIRGGGEFGPEWHKGAMKEKRQNAYNDFYAVCEDLITRNVTNPAHMGAFGWSNGGLMAGVVATQRPDLFNAVIIGAPLLDMKRYNKMLAGASWMGEYGNPDIPEEWEYIQKYSPYHNVFEGKEYPEVLFVTSTKDDRVHPAHARKMAARMIEQGHPIYYYETIEGGHGASSTNDQTAYNQALMFSYLWMKLR